METLSNIFFVFYYSFIILTLLTSIIYWVKQKYSIPAVIMIVLSLFTPLSGFLFSVQRPSHYNEWDFLITQLKDGHTWAIIISICHLYFLFWWGLLIFHCVQFIRMNKEKILTKFQRQKAS